MNNTDFLGMSSYVRVQEKRLLDHSSIDRVIDSGSLLEAQRMISQNTDYDFGALPRPEDYEAEIKKELSRVYKMAYGLSADFPALPDITGCKYDYHNVKVALKAKYLEGATGKPYIQATPIDPQDIEKLVEKYDSKSGLPQHIHEAVKTGEAAFQADSNPQDIDIALDRLMYRRMLDLAEEMESEFITGYVRNAIDFYNLKTLVRVKNMQKGTAFLGECMVEGGNTDPSLFLSSYGKTAGALSLSFAFKNYGGQMKAGIEAFERTGNYAELERLLDNYLIGYVKDAKRISFGPEILFTYLVSKENEVRQIRIIMACKQNQIPGEVLKERLRDNYV